jgi:NADPH2:quinone reductase
MHAIQIEAPGGPEAMKLAELPTPQPGPGAALVRIEAAGVNFIDVYQRMGVYKLPLPARLGMEGAGVIEALGAPRDGAPQGFAVGDRVSWAQHQGAYATQLAVPLEKLVRVPEHVSLEVACAAMLQGFTAHYLVNDTFPIKAGQTLLQYAGAGGTGRLLSQLAKQKGARVIATVGSEAKAELAKSGGADHVIVLAKHDVDSEVKRITEGQGVDVVYDSVGKDTFDGSIKALKRRGMLVLFGQSSGAVAPIDPQRLSAAGSLFFTRPTLGHHIAARAEMVARADELLGKIAAGKLDVRIGARFPLAEAGAAHQALEGRGTTGKVLLIP